MEFVDVVGKVDAVPVQIEVGTVKEGVTFSFTVIVRVTIFAHIPAVGVNVQVVVALLLNAGDQVPVMEFVDVVGKVNAVPEQMEEGNVKVGVTFSFTVIVRVTVFAHNPAVGVNVQVVVALLLNAGDQVPVMEFVDVVGKVNSVPEQMEVGNVKVGVAFAFTVIVRVKVFAHNPAVGVNVQVVVALLLNAGLHVPVIAFEEVVGKVNIVPEQIEVGSEKVGVTFALILIF